MATGFGRSSSQGCTEAPIPFPANPKGGCPSGAVLSALLLPGGRACLALLVKGELRLGIPPPIPGGMAAPPPLSHASALAPRCHSIHSWAHRHLQEPINRPCRPRVHPRMVPGLSLAAYQEFRAVPGSTSSPCISVLLPLGPVCTPPQYVFPALISSCSVEKSGGGPSKVTASTGWAGDKALLPFYIPPPWSSLLIDPGRTPLALGPCCLGLVNIGIFPFRSLVIDTGFQDVGNWVSSVFPSCIQARKVKTVGRTERLNQNDHRILHLHICKTLGKLPYLPKPQSPHL